MERTNPRTALRVEWNGPPRALGHERAHRGVVVGRGGVGDLRVAHVVVVETLDAVARHDLAEYRERVLARGGALWIDVDALEIAPARGVEMPNAVRAQEP